MPHIDVKLWPGRNDEIKSKLAKRIASTVAEELNCLPDSIFEYKRATLEDIEELVRARIIVLRAANKLSEDVDMSEVEKESYAYYKLQGKTGA